MNTEDFRTNLFFILKPSAQMPGVLHKNIEKPNMDECPAFLVSLFSLELSFSLLDQLFDHVAADLAGFSGSQVCTAGDVHAHFSCHFHLQVIEGVFLIWF